jgi:hypothetical protein
MMLYSIFLVCVVGTKNCDKCYAEMPRPPGMTASDVPDDAWLKICNDNNKDDHTFDNPVTNPQGAKVKITPAACLLSNGPPPGALPANEFRGYH